MKEADCGIAMASGAQAASQVAQLVLLNNDFSTLPGIVDEGRRVINNIQRAAALFLVKNIFSFFTSIITIVFTLPVEEISTIAAAILSVVGLLVLYQICKPLDIWRRIVWAAMAALLVVCFTTLKTTFSLHLQTEPGKLLMMTLLIMTPTVFFFFQRVFDAGDWLANKLRREEAQ